MENNERLKIKKIPIEILIEILSHVFEEGYDFVDIEGEMDGDNVRDTITLTVCPAYHSDNTEEEELDSDITVVKNDKLSDEDLNELI
jgi:hypothetical protein